MPGDREAGHALDLRDRVVDEAARDLGDRAAFRADDVLVMVSGSLEPSPAIPEVDPVKVAIVREPDQGAVDR
jgi:hypothetical protein